MCRPACCAQLKQITHTTKWVDAQAIFSAHEAFQTDLALQQTDPIDLLIAYEDHILKLEREYEAARAAERASAKRAERKNRDAFKVRLTAAAAAVQALPECATAADRVGATAPTHRPQALLDERVASGDLKTRTKWADFFPLIKDDPRLLNMLDQPGYGPTRETARTARVAVSLS